MKELRERGEEILRGREKDEEMAKIEGRGRGGGGGGGNEEESERERNGVVEVGYDSGSVPTFHKDEGNLKDIIKEKERERERRLNEIMIGLPAYDMVYKKPYYSLMEEMENIGNKKL